MLAAIFVIVQDVPAENAFFIGMCGCSRLWRCHTEVPAPVQGRTSRIPSWQVHVKPKVVSFSPLNKSSMSVMQLMLPGSHWPGQPIGNLQNCCYCCWLSLAGWLPHRQSAAALHSPDTCQKNKRSISRRSTSKTALLVTKRFSQDPYQQAGLRALLHLSCTPTQGGVLISLNLRNERTMPRNCIEFVM
jgi:hypothetical protein